MSDNLIDQYRETKNTLNKISNSFCLAKWLQVTLHLQNGFNHSCHHPKVHNIPKSLLSDNPSALHNTPHKKSLRKQMLEGERPKECEYCWKIEDLPGENFSDRITKSHDTWAMPFLEKVLTSGSDRDINPTYLEVSFSNSCNLKCLYCIPFVSSKWMSELKSHGEYNTISKHHSLNHLDENNSPIESTEKNPYVKAFWDWWPTLYKELKHFRITGGEPLLINDTYKVLDYILNNPNPELSLSINSNLAVERRHLDKLIEKIKKIQIGKDIKEITIYTSLDTFGTHAEYIRHGLKLKEYTSNIEYLLKELPEIKLSFMCTFNLLSIPNFRSFLEYILFLKNRFRISNDSRATRITLDISYLKEPVFMRASLANIPLKESLKSDLNFMLAHKELITDLNQIGFSEYEKNKFKRLIQWIDEESVDEEAKNVSYHDIFVFFNEHDKRNGTNFLNTFDSFNIIWEKGKIIHEKISKLNRL